ncbi:hypothetical protein [Desulfurococcus mucosus]|uniref:Uncharacterized protein n=1 Tax=Desulfurococcus mucosus (strain ATCC 35584 / DSM 2162 / JCM 9187 / O7/1) TaxID=765177 RepID=E8R7T7_DESM0|nr:hypothetical protein [Desulfurococcus mucosus]ADV64563.1 hypothetical protein Desmu_0244 [Desulfurococcus mucosus DSM 2162]
MGVILVKMDENGRVLDYTTDALKMDGKKFNTILGRAVDLARIELLAFRSLGMSDVKSISITTTDFTVTIGRGAGGNLVIVTLKDEATAST